MFSIITDFLLAFGLIVFVADAMTKHVMESWALSTIVMPQLILSFPVSFFFYNIVFCITTYRPSLQSTSCCNVSVRTRPKTVQRQFH